MVEPVVQANNLCKSFIIDGTDMEIFHNITFDVHRNEFLIIVGPSGCGKTTLLKIIAGLIPYSNGTVLRNGKNIDGTCLECCMVFQEHRLLPWLRIKENIAFGISKSKTAKEERSRIAQKYINLVQLNGFENVYPYQLSGGMAQRAAIARALANNPSILLLDEPFGSLDALTRIQMQKEIKKIHEEEKITIIMVTHDLDEAVALGHRVIVLSSRPAKIRNILSIEDKNSCSVYKDILYKHFFN